MERTEARPPVLYLGMYLPCSKYKIPGTVYTLTQYFRGYSVVWTSQE